MPDIGGMTTWHATWIIGPAAGRTTALPPGRHLLGSSRLAGVRGRDPALEPFHAEVVVDHGSCVRVTQLAGRSPLVSDERAETAGDGTWTWSGEHASVELAVGASRLCLHRDDREPSAAEPCDSEPARSTTVRTVHRTPRAVPVWDPDPLTVPDPARAAMPPPSGLVPALVGLAGTGALAVVLGQPMFLLFGAIGALVAVTSWVLQWVSARRGRRVDTHAASDALAGFAAVLQEQRDARLAHHLLTVGSLPEALAILDGAPLRMWPRRADHPGAFTAALGIGDVTWEPVLVDADRSRIPSACWGLVERASVLTAVPVPVQLGPGDRVALCGPTADSVARSLVVQLAVASGPADWQLVIVSDDPDRWAWALGLPHLADGPDGVPRLLGPAEVGDLVRDEHALAGRHMVIVTDDVAALAVRTHPLRRLLGGDLRPALIALAPGPFDAPTVSTAVLDVHTDGSARWTADVARAGLPVPLAVTGIHPDDATDAVARLAVLRDPEDPRSAGGAVPATVDLLELLGVRDLDVEPDAGAIVQAWRCADPDRPPATPIGTAADGVVDVDLVRDGPHALLAGTTGSGKSELLRSLVIGLAARCSPEQVTFVLVDYKGGATFDLCRELPHVVGVVTDLDDHLAARALRSLHAELRHREAILRDHAATDLTALRRVAGRPVLPRLVVVIDEFAALAVELPEFLHALVGIAQRGRSLGVHLVLATQRPHGVISDDIRANTNLRIALRLQDVADSRDVLDAADAATLPRDRPGRAVMRLGADELVTFQTARCDSDAAARLTRSIVVAADLAGLARPRRPWLDPLPSDLTAAALEPGRPGATAIGLVDLPDQQARAALTWPVESGGLLVVGARGSGVTSTLRAAALATLDDRSTLLVVDALGDAAWNAVAEHPRCAAVVRLHERERLARVLALVGRSDPAAGSAPADAAAADSRSRLVLVIDGLAALRAELDTVERADEHELLVRTLTGRGRAGVATALGNPDAHAVPATMLARCTHRWLLHVPDRHEGEALGRRVAVPPAGRPGAAVVVESPVAGLAGADAQLIRPDAVADPAQGARRARRLDVLPARVEAHTLAGRSGPRIGLAGATEWAPVIGLAADDLAPVRVIVPDGEHVMVLGPARSGRSTALARLVAAWNEERPDAWAGLHALRRSPLPAIAELRPGITVGLDLGELVARMPDHGPRLLVVDDAEMTGDDGRLEALLAARATGLVVVVAARPEALRASYGHWTAAIRRSHRGLLLSGCHDTDGDLLGAVVPRHVPIAPRPGLGHLVEDGTLRLVQVAVS